MTVLINPTHLAGPLRVDAAHLAWNRVGSYGEYTQARRAVEDLADRGFPIEHLDIIGSELRSVERVTGRLTKGRAAARGAARGVWFGMLIGAVLGMFGGAAWPGFLAAGVTVGAAAGALSGILADAGRGARHFESARALTATRYDVIARDGHADAARNALSAPGVAAA